MDEQQQLINQVRMAVGLAYGTAGQTNNSAQRKEADNWLQEFQRGPSAWQISDALLLTPDEPPENKFFAAQTLHAKLQYDFHELPKEAIPSLKDSLLDHVRRASMGSGSRALIIRLCLAISALAVQINWENCVESLCQAFPPGDLTASGTVLMELLAVLPEEATSSRVLVDEDTRDTFMQQLFFAAPQVLGYLCHVRHQTTQNLDGHQKFNIGVLECFATWIEYCQIPASTLVQCPLMNWAINQAIQDAFLFESCVDLMITTLRTYSIEREEDLEATKVSLAQLLIPTLMKQREAYQYALNNGDDDTCRGLCRVFTEIAESYLHLLLLDEPVGQLEILEQVLKCTSHPEQEIAGITLRFWYRLIKAMSRLPKEQKEKKFTEYGAGFMQLAEVCVGLMKLPEDFSALSQDQADDVDRFRLDIGDTLDDCCQSLGEAAVLNVIANILQTEMAAINAGQGNWQQIEACLFALQSISKSVPETEAQIIPTALQMLPQLSASHALVRRTATIVVGEYANFLKNHQDLLTPLFEFLLAGFADSHSASAAATSIKRVCKRCGALMGEPVLGLHAELVKAQQENRIALSAELEVLEGLCHVVGTLDPERATAAIQAMAQPIGEKLAGFAANGGETKEISAELDRLTVLVRYSRPKIPDNLEHPIVIVMGAIIPVFDGVLNHIQGSNNTVERLCRCYKHALRTCKQRFHPLLRALMDQLLTRFRHHPHAAYLYAASICVTEFSKQQEYIPDLFGLLEGFSAETFSRLQTFDHYTASPDLVEEYFYFVARFLSYCPGPLLSSPVLPSVVQCGIVGLQLRHREAQSGILTFFEELISTGIETPYNEKAKDYLTSLEPILTQFGPNLVEGLVQIMTGTLPTYALDDSGGSVGGVMFKLYHLSEQALSAWLAPVVENIPSNVATNNEKSDFLQSIIKQPDRDCFCDVIYNFAKMCQQRSRKWHR